MRRSVIISINPKWCEKIAAGQKQIEIRKNRPTYETPYLLELRKRNMYQNELTDDQHKELLQIISNKLHLLLTNLWDYGDTKKELIENDS